MSFQLFEKQHEEYESMDRTGVILSITESVCPICFLRLPAKRVIFGDDVYLVKDCPTHGHFQTILWRGEPRYSEWIRPKIPAVLQKPFTSVAKGCPFDCGLCSDHRQQPCCVLMDVTQSCDLSCSFCFASSGVKNKKIDPPIAVIEGWYKKLLEAGGPFNIQLSGGEPCLRDDLPEVIAMGKRLGFTFFQVNTNGLRISNDRAFLRKLKQAGLCTVYLQFDGTRDEIYVKTRGRKLMEQKIRVIENCAIEGLGVVLVPTLVPGVNTDDIGGMIHFAVEHAPTVRGIHFQPVSYFGRYPQIPSDADRITIPEVVRAIEAQTSGMVKLENFIPPGGENAHCSFHANFVILANGELKALTHHETNLCCCTEPERAEEGARKSRLITARHWAIPKQEPHTEKIHILGEWDDLLERVQHYSFSISGMAFQDVWNLDLDRLHDCYIMQITADGKLVPFCAYNLTNQQGETLYRNK